MKKLATLVLVLLLILIAVVPAAADQPTKTYDVPTGGEWQPWIDCRPLYDFEIWDTWTGVETVTVFYDQNGNVVRQTEVGSGVHSFYRPDRPSVRLAGHGSWVVKAVLVSSDPVRYESTWLGPTFDVQLPGQPKLVHVSGAITVLTDGPGNGSTWLEVLKQQGHSRFGFPELCEYFAD